MDKKMVHVGVYIGLELIPIAITLFLVFIVPLITPNGFEMDNYDFAFYLTMMILVLYVIINPVLLVKITNHYLIKHGINFILSMIMPIVSGIGCVLLLNVERWKKNGNWDFTNEIMFTVELVVVGVILLIGLAFVAYSKFKGRA